MFKGHICLIHLSPKSLRLTLISKSFHFDSFPPTCFTHFHLQKLPFQLISSYLLHSLSSPKASFSTHFLLPASLTFISKSFLFNSFPPTCFTHFHLQKLPFQLISSYLLHSLSSPKASISTHSLLPASLTFISKSFHFNSFPPTCFTHFHLQKLPFQLIPSYLLHSLSSPKASISTHSLLPASLTFISKNFLFNSFPPTCFTHFHLQKLPFRLIPSYLLHSLSSPKASIWTHFLLPASLTFISKSFHFNSFSPTCFTHFHLQKLPFQLIPSYLLHSLSSPKASISTHSLLPASLTFISKSFHFNSFPPTCFTHFHLLFNSFPPTCFHFQKASFSIHSLLPASLTFISKSFHLNSFPPTCFTHFHLQKLPFQLIPSYLLHSLSSPKASSWTHFLLPASLTFISKSFHLNSFPPTCFTHFHLQKLPFRLISSYLLHSLSSPKASISTHFLLPASLTFISKGSLPTEAGEVGHGFLLVMVHEFDDIPQIAKPSHLVGLPLIISIIVLLWWKRHSMLITVTNNL